MSSFLQLKAFSSRQTEKACDSAHLNSIITLCMKQMDILCILKKYIHSVLCTNKLHDPILNSSNIIQNYVS